MRITTLLLFFLKIDELSDSTFSDTISYFVTESMSDSFSMQTQG
jgi:hypothetical protein